MKSNLIHLLPLLLPPPTQSLAYAPNFITKIIDSGLSSSDKTESDRISGYEIHTRFPPEPNGYLHLGHAKAIHFNFYVARKYDGACNLRMDDTNPSKEEEEYVDSIKEDVTWSLEGTGSSWEDGVKMTSDYFDFIYECALSLIGSGDAYVDSLSAEEMREYRGTLTSAGKNSPYRERSPEENLSLFEEMKEGKHPEGSMVLRAKIDMSSPNMNLRDPTLYRIQHKPHANTGEKWCIYPMYDFSHPISDAVEHITHSLCTLEFEDHRPLYDWVLDKLHERKLIEMKPRQIEFSRLNMAYTVLSKRKLITLVSERKVEGWDDPRMPTLSGIRRRGIPPAAIRKFCEEYVGISKSDSLFSYSDLENCVREVMDLSSPRAFAVFDPVKIVLQDWSGGVEHLEIPRHPKYPELGNRTIPFGKEIYIDRNDVFDTCNGTKTPPKGFKRLILPDGYIRLKFGYILHCHDVVYENKEIVELHCTHIPESIGGYTPPDLKKKCRGILQWVEASNAVPITVKLYDRLFRVPEPGKSSDNFLEDINPTSLQTSSKAYVEPSVGMDALAKLAQIRNSDTMIYPSSLSYQFERCGYFAMDVDSSMKKLVFNRVVTLRDSWEIQQQPPETQPQQQRRRGRGNAPTETLQDIQRVALRVGTLLEVAPHPNADSLSVCKFDFDEEEPRQVITNLDNIREYLNKQILCIANLKPAKIMGELSHAMIIGTGGTPLRPAAEVSNGELVSVKEYPAKPDEMLKSKGALKVWDRVKESMKCNEEGKLVCVWDEGKGGALETSSGVAMVGVENGVIE